MSIITVDDDQDGEDSVYNRMPPKETFTVEANCRVRGRRKPIDYGSSNPEDTYQKGKEGQIYDYNPIPHKSTFTRNVNSIFRGPIRPI
jgi:hypothetical protein